MTTGYPRAVVLDFDGVVLQSDRIKTWAFGALFADHPHIVDDVVALHERLGGISRYRKFEMIYEQFLDLPLSAERSRELGEAYSALVLDEVLRCPMVDGAQEFLEGNPADRPLYVASGSPHEELNFTVRERGLAHHFTGCFGFPHEKPGVIGEVLRIHDVDPLDLVFVGDAWSDFEAARVTGVRFVGVVRSDAVSPFPAGVVVRPNLVGLNLVLNRATPCLEPPLPSENPRPGTGDGR